MKIVKEKISRTELVEMSGQFYDEMVKAVVDVRLRIMAVGGDLHSDEEAFLLEQGSKQFDLWGINIYPEKQKSEWVEYDSMINLRPAQSNRTRGVKDPELRKIIAVIVDSLVE